MGLDMYLSARLYTGQYFNPEALAVLRSVELPGITIPGQYIENMDSFEIEVPIAYWRKANHIHKWFVENVQGGEDNCQSSDVDVEQLRELDKLCAEVVTSGSPEVAAEKLPCEEGFFFGGTDYDTYYFEQCRETMDALRRLLADIDSGKLAGWDFVYRASW